MDRFQNRAGVCPARRCDRAQARRGHAVIEVGLLLPWLVFTFIAALDFGIYNYALICTQNAARIGATYLSATKTLAQSGSINCDSVLLDEFRNAPGVGSTCGTVIQVAKTYLANAAAGSPDGLPAVRVTVTYQTPQLIPLPGVLSGSLTVSRTAVFPVRDPS